MSTKFLSFCAFLFTVAAAQNPVSVVWPLTADQKAVVTGDVTAPDQQLMNMQVSYSSSVQRSSPAGTAGTWTAESGENASRYVQFVVTPKAGSDLTVTSIALKLYVNSGSSMSANVYYSTDTSFAVKTKIGGTMTLSSSAPATPNVTVSPNIVVTSGSSLVLRVYSWYATATTGKYVITNGVTVTGTTLNATAPLLTLGGPLSIEFGKAVSGTSVNGAAFTVAGINLASEVTVKAPKGFAVSADSSVFADSVLLSPVAGTIAATPVYTRFAPTSATGLSEEMIAVSSSGATTKSVAVSGTSLAAEPTQSSTVSAGSITGSSAVLTLSGGNGNRHIVVLRKDSAVSFLPTDGAEISGTDSSFAAAVDQGNGNKVVYDGTANTVTVSGLSVASTYRVAVYDYNIGTGNSQNYKQSDAGTGTFTTLAVPGLSVSTAHLAFGNVVSGKTSGEKSFQFSGSFLSPASGNVTMTAPAGFQISLTTGTGFDSVLTIPYASGTIAATTIRVRFQPVSMAPYGGSITANGGSAPSVTVSLTGTGVDQVFVPDSIPFGFASLGSGTTGGAGGTAIVITSGQQLADIMKPREKTSDPGTPLLLYISGTISGYGDEVSIKRTKNISIIGVGTDAKVQGFGFKIVESSNIIVRNISFADCKAGEKDAISVEGSNNVWIDHCSFTDSPSLDFSGSSHDGLLDVKKGSYNVTLSYNYFTNHRKTCLLGHSVSETGDVAMRVTYYRNWWDGTYSRQPRARYGKAHIINNLYTSVGILGADKGGYGVGTTCGAHLLVEGNYFENTMRPTLISQVNDPEETLSGDPVGYLKAVNNYVNGPDSIWQNLNGYSFDPSESYAYTALDAAQVKELVKATAGAGRLDGGTTAVINSRSSVATTFDLAQNFPNPFNPSTMLRFTVQRDQHVTLSVYNALGQKIATLFSGTAEQGRTYDVRFNAGAYSSGTYFSILEGNGQRIVRKLLLVK